MGPTIGAQTKGTVMMMMMMAIMMRIMVMMVMIIINMLIKKLITRGIKRVEKVDVGRYEENLLAVKASPRFFFGANM